VDFDTKIERRDFIKFICVLTVNFIIPHSSEAKTIKRLLDNEDRPGFYIRFIKPTEPVDPQKWILHVGGLCENPRSFKFSDITKLTKVTQISRLKCVESWSSKASWGGFRPKTLFDIVKPRRAAKFLYFYSADDYFEYIPLEKLLKPRVLFAHEMNGALLPDIHGGPLRLIMPSKYGYKSVKTILKLDFVEKETLGYWSSYGYSAEATIQPGIDHALDLDTYKIIKSAGEPDY